MRALSLTIHCVLLWTIVAATLLIVVVVATLLRTTVTALTRLVATLLWTAETALTWLVRTRIALVGRWIEVVGFADSWATLRLDFLTLIARGASLWILIFFHNNQTIVSKTNNYLLNTGIIVGSKCMQLCFHRLRNV